jgi:polyisoprenoid-binding protein YceI
MTNLKTISLVLFLLPLGSIAQDRFGTRNGHVSFRSETPIENIEANNHKASSVFDASTGDVQFAVLIKAFEFKKALMQEHFNENYMESNTYPKATFKGKLRGAGADEMTRPGTYVVNVTGDLTIHGVTKPMNTKGSITVAADGSISVSGEFPVVPEDHGIKIPGVVRDNIAQVIEVRVELNYTKL